MFDAIVIGGGPAGCAAAIRLARSGRRVCLYEKATFPRPKLCGGFLSPEALEDLDDLGILNQLRATGAPVIRRTVLASHRGTIVESSLPGETLSTSRDILDELLLQQACRCGVEIRIGEDGFRSAVPATWRVVAAGRLAIDPENPGLPPLTPWYATSPVRYFGIQALYENGQGISDQVELDLVDSGYVGLACQQDGRINVCTLTTQETVQRYGPDLDNVMAHFIEENAILRAHLEGARRVSSWMAVGPVRMGIRHLVSESTFYTGDAACVMDPFAGEGMAMGLYASRLLVEALDQKRLPAAQAYTRLWHQAYDPALRWNALMRMVYSFGLLREPLARALQLYPAGLARLSELTRYRRIESIDQHYTRKHPWQLTHPA